VRWLLLKDLRILKRSPLLVGLLVLYPIVIATLIGFALSRGPEKPRVAFYNGVPTSADTITLGGTKIDLRKESRQLFDAIEAVPVKSKAAAIKKVKDGDVLGALIIPPDITQKLQSTLQPGTVQVYYNAEDPAKKQYVENTIKSQVQTANTALTKKIAQEALQLLDLIRTGGDYSFLGQSVNVLGLERSQQILHQARRDLPARDQPGIDQVAAFAKLAHDNLGFSNDVLNVVGSPLRVDSHVVNGGATSLTSFAVAIAVAVSLMFITVLLAAGSLALEREENAFPRLVRGLVSNEGLLLEKAGLAAVCSLVVSLLMLAFLGLFVELRWSRFPLWLVGIVAGGLAFAAMGLALGAVAREVRAASLLAFMLALPLAFLALVPSGAVSTGLYDVIRVISALFPFKATLDALDAGLNDAGSMGVPLLHLAILFAAYGAISRLALRRFA
jgi:ABC-2 type transport system permease protein